MGINVFFAGLMLVCLQDQANCSIVSGMNTAWVLQVKKADDICGHKDDNPDTYLEARFEKGEFTYSGTLFDAGLCLEDFDKTKISCTIPYNYKEVCLIPVGYVGTSVDTASLDRLLRINELDRRFKALSPGRLSDPKYVPTHIRFPTGNISAGPYWHVSYQPTWFRSDGEADGSLPRPLATSLSVRYEKSKQVKIIECGKEETPLLLLDRLQAFGTSELEIRNAASVLNPDVVSGYDSLAYLLAYHRLGTWEGGGECPRYPENAVTLRCKRAGGQRCAQYDSANRDTTFWPVMRGPAN